MLSRKDLLKSLLLAGAGTAVPISLAQGQSDDTAITVADLKSFEKVAGITFTDDERSQILSTVRQGRGGFETIRKLPIDFTTEPRDRKSTRLNSRHTDIF